MFAAAALTPTAARGSGVFASEAEIMQRISDVAHETDCLPIRSSLIFVAAVAAW
jgi:hypothetical protein